MYRTVGSYGTVPTASAKGTGALRFRQFNVQKSQDIWYRYLRDF